MTGVQMRVNGMKIEETPKVIVELLEYCITDISWNRVVCLDKMIMRIIIENAVIVS